MSTRPMRVWQLLLAINRSSGFVFYHNVQISLSWLRQQAPADIIAGIYERELRYHEGCPARATPSSYRLRNHDGGGVAIIFGVLCGLSLIAATYETRAAEKKEKARKRT